MLELPLFPLDLVLLPYESLPLHIFEPRYKKMVKNAIEQSTELLSKIGLEARENHKPSELSSALDQAFAAGNGCQVEVSKVFKEYKNGEYDILVKGTEPFDVISTKKDGDTIIGNVEYINLETEGHKTGFQELQDTFLRVLLRFGINTDLELHMDKQISYEFLQGIQLPITVKKDILDINKESDRLLFINGIFNNILKTDIQSDNGQRPEA